MKKNVKNDSVYASVRTYEQGSEVLCSFIDTLKSELGGIVHDLPPSTPLWQIAAIHRFEERCAKRAQIGDRWATSSAAVLNFVEVNELCGDIVPSLDSDIISDARDFIVRALERFTAKNCGDSSELNLGLLLQNWKYGPGSSVGLGPLTHFAQKIGIANPTCTKKALPYAKLLRKLNPHLFAFDGKKDCDFKIVRGSSLSTVPKNEEIDRTICTEPLMNMALQLAAGWYIEGALRCVGIDISNQQLLNKWLAMLGSDDGGIATIDLKNASDLISMLLIKLLWPSSWYTLFTAIRSEECKVQKDCWVQLNMMSTMGNGFTFPMMTLTLLALVYATQSSHCKKRFFIDYSCTAVFGDDVIVKSSDYEAVCTTLTQAGLVVNTNKSFWEGPFRESCGGDYWYGYNITPVYVSTLYSDPEIYCAINQLQEWSYRTGIYLPKSMAFLLGKIDSGAPFLVPWWSDPCEGIWNTEVNTRYKSWKPAKEQVRFKNLDKVPYPIALLMVIPSYVESVFGARVCFSPREVKCEDPQGNPIPNPLKWKLATCRMPRGYFTGHDYGKRDHETLNWLSFSLALASEGTPITPVKRG